MVIECERCKRLEQRIVELSAEIRALRKLADDLMGVSTKDSMYDDEKPLIPERDFDEKGPAR